MNKNGKKLILGIETSTDTGSIALSLDDTPVSELTVDITSKGSERLVPVIDFMLSQSGFSSDLIDAVSLAIGPGSYTGLRIGLSTAKALCFANEIPLVTVCSLHALALRLPLAFFPVAPLIDAHASLVYGALFKWGQEDISPKAMKLVDFIELLPKNEIVIFTGPDLDTFREKINSVRSDNSVFADKWVRIPSAMIVSCLGYRKLSDGDIADLDELTPEYLRDFMPTEKK